ncbi:hypothetical protein BDV98DRAFT_536903 [Pterulicium gracile]|uniref:Short-chain dehydrogenase n=1 Tax=Pterulicium gracile TaxID=1884261 RepID=A0A5C3Q4X7_9AGAR|nr:hypothetical protein BDV98DRAFT_536903 [Pterula gracilis]
MKFSMSSFVYEQWSRPLPVASHDLTGQTVVVLGANVGLGFEAAKHFARMKPAKLILACRNQSKADDALANLRKETGYEGGEVWLVDLLDFASVSKFGERFHKKEARLDIFVANAAVAPTGFEVSEEGYEQTLHVNHLSTALISLLLLPKMEATAKLRGSGSKPRLVIVSSEVHHWYQFDAKALAKKDLLKYLGSEEYCTPAEIALGRLYLLSKLLNVFFTRALASRLSSVTIDTVNPGYCYSGLRRNYAGVQAIVDRLQELALARSTEVGSRQLVWAALEGKDTEVHGQYISNFGALEPADYVLENGDLEERIWDETLAVLSKVEPKVAEVARGLLGVQ